MAINIENLKNRLVKLQNNDKFEKVDLPIWKPKAGTSTIRIVPYQHNVDSPFSELYFHYDNEQYGKQGNKISLRCFGKEDPFIEESKVWLKPSLDLKTKAKELETSDPTTAKFLDEKSKVIYKFGKSFEPSLRIYVSIIVRGEEEKGVKFWPIGVTIYKKLIEIITNPEYGDIADIEKGFDLLVSFAPPLKDREKHKNYTGEYSKNSFGDISVTPKRMPSLLLPENATEQLVTLIKTQQPNIYNVFKEPTLEEVNKCLQGYLKDTAAIQEELIKSIEDINYVAKVVISENKEEASTPTVKTETKVETPSTNTTVSSEVKSKFKDLFNEE